MADILLNDICAEHLFAPSICRELPADSKVLFLVTGRFDSSTVSRFVHCALDEEEAGLLDAYQRRNLNLFVPGRELDGIRDSFKGKEEIISLFHEALSEILLNATSYGFDAFLIPRLWQPLTTNGDKSTPVYESSTLLVPSCHASLAVAYSSKDEKLCFLAQNFAIQSEANSYARRCKEVNSLTSDEIENRFRAPLKQTGREAHTRQANRRGQPLLQKGGPMGSAVRPIATLSETFNHSSGRVGTLSAAHLSKNPILTAHTDIAFTNSYMITEETTAAFDLAVSLSNVRPEQVKSMTVAVSFNV